MLGQMGIRLSFPVLILTSAAVLLTIAVLFNSSPSPSSLPELSWDFPTKGSLSLLHPYSRTIEDHAVIARHMHRLAVNFHPTTRHHLLLHHEFIDFTEPGTHWTAGFDDFSPSWSDATDEVSRHQYVISAALGVSKQDVLTKYPELDLSYYLPWNSWKVTLNPAQAAAMARERQLIARVAPWEDVHSMEMTISSDERELHHLGWEPVLRVHIPKDYGETALSYAEEIMGCLGSRGDARIDGEPDVCDPAYPVAIEDEHVFLVDVGSHDLLRPVGRKLAAHPGVEHVEPVAIATPENAWGRASVQGGSGKDDVTPLWTRGLHGEGVVVGILDTGCDPEHCSFVDAENAVGPAHRKIIAQFTGTRGDSDDRASGHGTHCAGSIAGEWNGGDPEDPEHMSGVAYKAKIACYDGTDEGTDGIFSPSPRRKLFEDFMSVGAYVSSNSWSTKSLAGTYTTYSADVDEWHFENTGHLTIFAGGNNGSQFDEQLPAAPGNAKNALSVGAAVNDPGSWQEISYGCEPEDLPVPDPDAACGSVGAHPFTWNDLSAPNTDFATYASSAFFSSLGPMSSDGRLVPQILASGYQTLSARAGDFGPTETCQYTLKQGTSMATPTVAGAAALAVQYLQEGFHPTGKATEGDELDEMFGPGLKAVLINGAHRMGGRRLGSTQGPQDLDGETYNGMTGFGALRLDTVLAFEDSDFNSTFWWNGAPGAFSEKAEVEFAGDERTITVRAGSEQPLRITMCYYDTASSTQAALNLKNDIDLTVENAEGKTLHYGNELAFNAQENSASKVDPCEKIEIPEPDPQLDYVIRVRGVDLPDGTIAFALVATGGIPPERDFVLQPWMIYAGIGGLAFIGVGVAALVLVRTRSSLDSLEKEQQEPEEPVLDRGALPKPGMQLSGKHPAGALGTKSGGKSGSGSKRSKRGGGGSGSSRRKPSSGGGGDGSGSGKRSRSQSSKSSKGSKTSKSSKKGSVRKGREGGKPMRH